MIVRNFTFIFVFLLVAMKIASAQQVKSKISIVKIITHQNESVKGILYEVGDSSVSIYADHSNIDRDALARDALPLKVFSYRDIREIKLRRRSSVIEGALIGVGAGIIIGLIIDAGAGNNAQVVLNLGSSLAGAPAQQAAFSPVATITLGLIGTGAGAAIGSASKTIEVDWSKQLFEAARTRLLKYSFRKNF